MLQIDLQHLFGLSEKESKTYLGLLELGETTVLKLSDKIDINRATVYTALEKLSTLGLVGTITKGKKQYFVATKPEKLEDILQRDQQALEQKKVNFQKLIPLLKGLDNTDKNKPVIRFFQGKDGVAQSSRELLKEGNGINYVVYSADASPFSKKESEEYKRFKENLHIQEKVLFTGTKQNQDIASAGNEKRFVPFEKFQISSGVMIFKDTVRLSLYGEKMGAVLIEDKTVAATLRAMFDLAWEGAGKYK